MALAAGPIVAFLEGTVVYALSQQWEDLLSTYLFRLHAVPNCGEHLVLACSAEASAPRQFQYVAGLLATSALVQTWAEVGPLPYAWHVWRTVSVMKVVPRMIANPNPTPIPNPVPIPSPTPIPIPIPIPIPTW